MRQSPVATFSISSELEDRAMRSHVARAGPPPIGVHMPGRAPILLLFLFLAPGHVHMFAQGCARPAGAPNVWQPLVIGFVAGTVLWCASWSRIAGLTTLEHELTRALVALMFFRRVVDIRVARDQGGHVQHEGGFGGLFGNEMIGLAPYFLPTFAVLPALLLPLAPDRWVPWVIGLVGAMLAYQVFSTAGEMRPDQTDIRSRGMVYIVVLVASLSAGLHGILWHMLAGGYVGCLDTIKGAWAVNLVLWRAAGEWTLDLLRHVSHSVQLG